MQFRILVLLLLLVLAGWLLGRLWRNASRNPRVREALRSPGARLMLLALLRRALPWVMRLLRGLRFFR